MWTVDEIFSRVLVLPALRLAPPAAHRRLAAALWRLAPPSERQAASSGRYQWVVVPRDGQDVARASPGPGPGMLGCTSGWQPLPSAQESYRVVQVHRDQYLQHLRVASAPWRGRMCPRSGPLCCGMSPAECVPLSMQARQASLPLVQACCV